MYTESIESPWIEQLALLPAPPASHRPIRELASLRARAWQEGPAVLADNELIALVLGRDHPAGPTSEEVLRRAGGLEGLGRVGPGLFADIPGLGDARALRLMAAVEIGRRVIVRCARPRTALPTPAAVAAHLAPRVGQLEHEQMWVLSMDGRNRLRGLRCVAQGGLHSCVVTAREILRTALADGASGFVLAHNHPSGEPSPSLDDIEMTRAVAEAADVIGLPLLDHVIVTATGEYASLLDLGFLP